MDLLLFKSFGVYIFATSIELSDDIVWQGGECTNGTEFAAHWCSGRYSSIYWEKTASVDTYYRHETLVAVCTLYTVFPKKHPWHFRLQLENQLSDFDNFWQEYSWHNLLKWPFSFPPYSIYAFALLRQSRSSKICVEINRKPEKNILDIIDCNLIADFNNFWQKYFWHNWLLNKCFSFHVTQCLLLQTKHSIC